MTDMADKNLPDINPLLDAEKELRMVLVGKTGVGKSASGNTILGKKAFKSTASASSVTSECQKERGEFEGQTLAVVDTPGLFDTILPEDEVKREIIRCISLSAPGPHVFLVVIQPNRFTKEEQETVKIIQKVFGQKSADYTLALLTHGDDLEADEVTVETAISGNSALQSFIHQCGGGYHVFNNRQKDPTQVGELLEKINTMVRRNESIYYTSNMFKESLAAIQKEMKRLKTENPKIELQQARKQAETDNPFIKAVITVAVCAALAAVKTAAEKGEGPVGAVLTAVVTVLQNDACKIQ